MRWGYAVFGTIMLESSSAMTRSFSSFRTSVIVFYLDNEVQYPCKSKHKYIEQGCRYIRVVFLFSSFLCIFVITICTAEQMSTWWPSSSNISKLWMLSNNTPVEGSQRIVNGPYIAYPLSAISCSILIFIIWLIGGVNATSSPCNQLYQIDGFS